MIQKPFWANYIKPRTSNLTNMNSSLITNKNGAKTVFTGYSRQVVAINQGFQTARGATEFNGTEGPTLNNLKDGAVWTSPQILNAVQTTNYCVNGECKLPN
jgi:hypothetical protein